MRPDSLLRRCALVAVGTALGIGAVLAAPSWQELTARQQALITPALQSQGGNFDKLSEPRRNALVKGADRWLAMTPAQRATATDQFRQWQALSVEQKLAVLERRDRFRKMSPEERKALLETRDRFLEMPLQQQAELHTEFESLQPTLDGLSGQPLTPSTSPPPGSTVPLGLPPATLPGGTITTLPVLPH